MSRLVHVPYAAAVMLLVLGGCRQQEPVTAVGEAATVEVPAGVSSEPEPAAAVEMRDVIENTPSYVIGISYPPDWGERTMSLRRGDRSVLKPGMTFHFMTGLWSDEMGLEITESIAITEGAPELLASVPRKLFVKD